MDDPTQFRCARLTTVNERPPLIRDHDSGGLALTPVVWLQTLPILLVPIVLAASHPEALAGLRVVRRRAIA